MKISILVPSRGRPQKLKEMIDSAVDTATDPKNLEVVVYLDSDDQQNYRHLDFPKVNVIVTYGDRVVLSQMWNRCYSISTGEILMHAGDDILFRTKGWDSIVRAAFESFPDRIAFIHGDDGANKDSFGTHGFIHRNWAKTVSYFVPPYYSSDYNDTHLNDVANALNRRVYVPILTEHMHFLFGKGPKDQTHIDRLERGERDKVRDLYFSPEMEAGRKGDVRKLKEFIDNFSKK